VHALSTFLEGPDSTTTDCAAAPAEVSTRKG
jgi:hypothetical protein